MRYYLKNLDDAASQLSSLADNLVQHLGVEGALQMCRENSWYGVIQEIKGRLDQGVQH
ncbi:MAG: hypothetical protein OQK24_06125 [Magnetovibrio sp.]|nr:hypothetical protein [Magnetovibrio sp.]